VSDATWQLFDAGFLFGGWRTVRQSHRREDRRRRSVLQWFESKDFQTSRRHIHNPGGLSAGGPNTGEPGCTADLATAFTNPVAAQRAYSVSARIIATASTILDELIEMFH